MYMGKNIVNVGFFCHRAPSIDERAYTQNISGLKSVSAVCGRVVHVVVWSEFYFCACTDPHTHERLIYIVYAMWRRRPSATVWLFTLINNIDITAASAMT